MTNVATSFLQSALLKLLGELSLGSAGQIIQVNSGATDLEFADPASGEWVVHTAETSVGTGTEVEITGLSGKKKIKVIFRDISPDTDNCQFDAVVATGGAYIATGYESQNTDKFGIYTANGWDAGGSGSAIVDFEKGPNNDIVMHADFSNSDNFSNSVVERGIFGNGTEVDKIKFISEFDLDAGTYEVWTQ